jgi:hypothetical protein
MTVGSSYVEAGKATRLERARTIPALFIANWRFSRRPVEDVVDGQRNGCPGVNVSCRSCRPEISGEHAFENAAPASHLRLADKGLFAASVGVSFWAKVCR